MEKRRRKLELTQRSSCRSNPRGGARSASSWPRNWIVFGVEQLLRFLERVFPNLRTNQPLVQGRDEMLSGDETRSIIGAKSSIAGLLEVYMQNWSALFPSPVPKGTGEGKEKRARELERSVCRTVNVLTSGLPFEPVHRVEGAIPHPIVQRE